MSIKQKAQLYIATFVVLPVAVVAVASSPVLAEETTCGGVKTSIISCGGNKDSKNMKDSGIWHLLLMTINILSAGVGVLALAGIVYGSILYTSAGGNPEQVKKAKNTFINVAIGVIAFAGMFALLNFLVPGGVFNS